MQSTSKKIFFLRILALLLAFSTCLKTFGGTYYLSFSPNNVAYSVPEGSASIAIQTAVLYQADGGGDVGPNFNYQSTYFYSGTAVLGIDYTITVLPYIGATQTATYTQPNTTSGSFNHVGISGFNPTRIVITPLHNPAVTGTRTVTITRPAAKNYETALSVTIRFKDGDIISSPYSTFSNLSSRGQVGSGTNGMIAGFIVGGSGNKTILTRALGPSLSALGVTNPVADPAINLYSGSSVIYSNNDWASTQQSQISSTGLAPTNAKEAAILTTLAPGGYTVNDFASSSTPGIGLLEVWDLSGGTNPKLTNISTRANVGTGDNVLIVGFIIQGGAKSVLINGKGPSLAQYGLTPVPDPNLSLYDSNGNLIEYNDNWQGDGTVYGSPWNESSIQADPLHPTTNYEASILETLPAGAYTVILRGAGLTTGTGLIELFER